MVAVIVGTCGLIYHTMPVDDNSNYTTVDIPGRDFASRIENFDSRILPSWMPQNEDHYSFRVYVNDITLWRMLTDVFLSRQAAAVIMCLGGYARDVARTR